MPEFTSGAGNPHRLRSGLAAGYANRGWWVLPTRGRRPVIKEWETKATHDSDEAAALWHRKGDWAGFNIGIAPGPSDLVILDIDRKKGKNGFATLAKLGIELPDTYAVKTPSDGEHHYFAAPPGVEIRLSASQIGDGLDIRAWGGMIVAAGSEIDGVPYEVIRDVPPLALPDVILELIQNVGGTERRRKSAERVPDVIPEGERESRLVSLAGSMRRRGASVEAIYAAIDIENTARCTPPLSVEALERISGSVGRYEPVGDASETEIEIEIEVDPDLLAKTLTNLETTRIATELMKQRANLRQRSVLGGMGKPMSVLDWVKSGPDPTEVCIWGIPEIGGVMGWAEKQGILVAGPPGTGKSTLALQIILRRVGILGGPVLGMPVKVDKSPITYLALDRADQIRQSVSRMVPEDSDPEAIERLLMIDNLPPTIDLRKPETLIEWLNSTKSKAVVMDSLKDLGFDLNDSSEGQAYNFLVQAILRAGIEVFGLHHSRKVPRGDKKPLTLNDLHGSQWVAAGAGSVLMLDGEAGSSPKKIVHVKPLTVPMPPLQLVLDQRTGEVAHSDDLDFESDADTGAIRRKPKLGNLQDRILELLSMEPEALTNSELADQLGTSSGSVSKATRKLADLEYVIRNPDGWLLLREQVIP